MTYNSEVKGLIRSTNAREMSIKNIMRQNTDRQIYVVSLTEFFQYIIYIYLIKITHSDVTILT